MTYPVQVGVTFDFSSGAVFGYPFILDDVQNGVLGTSTLGSTSTAPKIVDISDQVLNISLQGGYNLLRDQFEAAQAIFTISDPTGIWNPTNESSPYWPDLVPLRKIRVYGVYAGQTHYVFSGYVTSYQYTYPKDQVVGYVTIQATDAFRLFQMSNVSTIPDTASGQDTGTRINKILDSISWPSSMRSITTGGSETICQADPGTNRTALDALKMVEYTEQGAFYMNGEGAAEFHSRAWLMAQSGKDPLFFSNAGDGIPYYNIIPALDDKLIINQAKITIVGGTEQSASNADSVAKYFPHTYTQSGVVALTNNDALNIAKNYVATRAETAIRIDSMTLDLNLPDYADGIEAALRGDYFQTFRIKNVGQDGTVIDRTLQVVGIAHTITPNFWRTTFTVSEPIVGSFILNSELYGVLGDYNSILGY
jgi:hypothetical protein